MENSILVKIYTKVRSPSRIFWILRFLVAFTPKIHIPLEFLLGSKITLAAPSRAVCYVDSWSYLLAATPSYPQAAKRLGGRPHWLTVSGCRRESQKGLLSRTFTSLFWRKGSFVRCPFPSISSRPRALITQRRKKSYLPWLAETKTRWTARNCQGKRILLGRCVCIPISSLQTGHICHADAC